MNPYDVHAAGHAMLQGILADPIGGPTSTQTGGYVIYGGAQYAANVGHFQVRQVLRPEGGGFAPMKMGFVWILKSILPQGTSFETGQLISAVDVAGKRFDCQIESVDSDEPTVYKLVLVDQAQSA